MSVPSQQVLVADVLREVMAAHVPIGGGIVEVFDHLKQISLEFPERLLVVEDALRAVARRVRQVRQVAGRAFEQTHRRNRLVGTNGQLPLRCAVAQRTAEPFAARLELLSAERAGCPRGDGNLHIGRPFAVTVDALDPDDRVGLTGVDQAQPADLVAVAAGVEGRYAASVSDPGCGIVHCRNEAIGRANVDKYLDV